MIKLWKLRKNTNILRTIKDKAFDLSKFVCNNYWVLT